MGNLKNLACLCVLAFVLLPLAGKSAVTVERMEYHGWPEAVRMTNGTVELVFVPQIGRIMRYGLVGGQNVLWENAAEQGKTPDPNNLGKDWVNYGGDKVWNAPQERWGWPPDPVLDRGGQTAELLPNHHLRVTGKVSPTAGIRFQREIILADNGTSVTIRNTLRNESKEKVNWSVWEVAQVDNPAVVRLPLHKARFAAGYYAFTDISPTPDMVRVTEKTVEIHRRTDHNGKIGVDAPAGSVTAEVAGHELSISAQYEAGRTYPDNGCRMQVYVSDDPNRYAEMELLSPIQDIAPGKSLTLITRWNLHNPPALKQNR